MLGPLWLGVHAWPWRSVPERNERYLKPSKQRNSRIQTLGLCVAVVVGVAASLVFTILPSSASDASRNASDIVCYRSVDQDTWSYLILRDFDGRSVYCSDFKNRGQYSRTTVDGDTGTCETHSDLCNDLDIEVITESDLGSAGSDNDCLGRNGDGSYKPKFGTCAGNSDIGPDRRQLGP